jgi:hypothetical protein
MKLTPKEFKRLIKQAKLTRWAAKSHAPSIQTENLGLFVLGAIKASPYNSSIKAKIDSSCANIKQLKLLEKTKDIKAFLGQV